MTAIIYFGEMLAASLLAIALLAISQLRMSSEAVFFAGGVVALTLAEYLVHRFVLHGFVPTEHRLHHANPDSAVLTIFWQIWICFALDRRRRFRCRRASRLCVVFVRAPLLASRSRQVAVTIAQASPEPS